MKQSILLLGATFMIVLAATSQTAAAQNLVNVNVEWRPNRGLRVDVQPWEVLIDLQQSPNCRWELTTASPGSVTLTIRSFWVRGAPGGGGIARPLPNLVASAAQSRTRGPFVPHPDCGAPCQAGTSPPPLERYDIVVDLEITPNNQPTESHRVVIDPGYRVRP